MMWNHARQWLLGASAASALLIGAASSASATTVTVGALKDAMIFGTSAGADTNNASGKGPALFAGADGSGNIKRSEIEFDVSSIPSNATVTSVTMTLFLGQVAGSGMGSGGNLGPRIFSLYDLQQDWGEGNSGTPTSASIGGSGQGYAEQNGDSTWDYAFFNSNPSLAVKWNLNGTNLHGGNFSSMASATSTFNNPFTVGAPFTWSSTGMVTDVQNWIDGASPDFGWMLKSDNLESTPTSFLGFWSKDGAAANNNPAIAPELTITYSTPEPAGFAMMFVLAPALLWRRKVAR